MAQANINVPVFVNVRVEGVNVEGPATTVFEGVTTTHGREVTAATGGTHLCDGTNGNENPLPGPTCTSALDDASRPRLSPRPFTWDGVYNHSLDDFLINRIGEFTATVGQTFWSLKVNFQPTPVGGGQMQIKSGDRVLWALVPSIGPAWIPLKLKGPLSAQANVQFTVNVSNGSDREPVQGATVTATAVQAIVEAETDANGNAMLTLPNPGTYNLKATRNAAITSDVLQVVVT